MKAYLTEIMESIQGEGLTAGARQIFLRFSGCNLRCRYCDTRASLVKPEKGIFYLKPGSNLEKEFFLNPLSIEDMMKFLQSFSSKWISLTGGEPLLWTDFISELIDRLKPSGYKFLLETNGTLVNALDKCIKGIDLISMDFKLPSATGDDNWDNHYLFLKKAVVKPCYVKVVVDDRSREEEIEAVFDIVRRIDPQITVILQPVTIMGKADLSLLPFLLVMQEKGLKSLKDIRIMPQMHTFLGFI
ncbi:7-carboxy-7-deazaguanine synthase QueE [Thermosyntropha sp.]|uniref:7-carboxy-7-deazaguanine synthase QueE n=1 Tax=Thermosyntropha sp. TaxID=2740820 RepID=UPI0025F43BCB|nr:7-carboxy-7-deazaguanine synthase QueE [Thermosyntropha sp.]MBO8158367.1 7-carboxy-7-deazaguanine synthase QueE [Thermosyntropha sp.]